MSTFNISAFHVIQGLEFRQGEGFLPWKANTVEVIYLPFYLSTLDDDYFQRVIAEINRVIVRSRDRRSQLVIVDDFISPIHANLSVNDDLSFIINRRRLLSYPKTEDLYFRSVASICNKLLFSLESISINDDGSQTLVLRG